MTDDRSMQRFLTDDQQRRSPTQGSLKRMPSSSSFYLARDVNSSNSQWGHHHHHHHQQQQQQQHGMNMLRSPPLRMRSAEAASSSSSISSSGRLLTSLERRKLQRRHSSCSVASLQAALGASVLAIDSTHLHHQSLGLSLLPDPPLASDTNAERRWIRNKIYLHLLLLYDGGDKQRRGRRISCWWILCSQQRPPINLSWGCQQQDTPEYIQ
jgi:hypothetical protein